MAALNAVMGNYFMESVNLEVKITISDEIVRIISSARYGIPNKESILSELSQESRVVQMNFVALACDNLHIPPPFENSYWERIKNPYQAAQNVDESLIQIVIETEQKNHNLHIHWPGISTSFDFLSLYTFNSQSSSLHEKFSEVTKEKIAGLTASTIDYVLEDAGLEMLINGSFVLSDDLKPSFRSGIPTKKNDILAIVPLKSLKEIEFFKLMSDTGISDKSLFQPFIDQLVYATLREFDKQNNLFANLPSS